MKQLGNILKTNVRACKALGHPYVLQLGRIYLDMLNVYKVMSENISSAIATNGQNVMKQPLIKSMRTVKKETLKLISGWVSRSNDAQMVSQSFPQLGISAGTWHDTIYWLWMGKVLFLLRSVLPVLLNNRNDSIATCMLTILKYFSSLQGLNMAETFLTITFFLGLSCNRLSLPQ